MSVTPWELDDRLHEFMRYHRQTMQRFFSGCGMFNGHPFLLFWIRRCPGITPAELAKHMELTPAAVTISLKRLEAEGLLRRDPDPTDGRRLRLTLTAAGEEMDDRCRRGRDFAAEATFRGFSDDEREQLAALLTRMRRNLETADSDAWLAAHTSQKEETT